MPPFSIFRRAALLLALAALSLAACKSTSTLSRIGYTEAMIAIAPGDVIKLGFPGASELNQTVRVRADGKISFPLVGDVQAAGKTLTSLEAELAKLYKPQLKDTDISLTLQNSLTAVYVSGSVNRPGKVPLDRPMTALEAIMEAGGPSSLANMSKVVVIRKTGNQHVTQTLDLGPTLHGRQTEAFTLRPFDIVQVPERFF